jgi:hypothetical protein
VRRRLLLLTGVLGLCAQAPAIGQEDTPAARFGKAIAEINAGLGTIKAVTAPPSFADPAQRARYDIVMDTMAQFNTPAFPVDGMNSFEAVCALLNEATVKHLFVGAAALRKPGMTDVQIAQALARLGELNSRVYEDEMVRLTSVNAGCLAAHIPFMIRFVASLKPGEFTPIRRNGLEQMGKGMANMIFGLATHSLSPGSTAQNSAVAMAAALKYAPDLVKMATPEMRQSIAAQMATLSANVPASLKPSFLKVKAIIQTQNCEDLCAVLAHPAP